MFNVVTLGDSILDCARYNEHGVHPGRLIVRNDDRLFPDFAGNRRARRRSRNPQSTTRSQRGRLRCRVLRRRVQRRGDRGGAACDALEELPCERAVARGEKRRGDGAALDDRHGESTGRERFNDRGEVSEFGAGRAPLFVDPDTLPRSVASA